MICSTAVAAAPGGSPAVHRGWLEAASGRQLPGRHPGPATPPRGHRCRCVRAEDDEVQPKGYGSHRRGFATISGPAIVEAIILWAFRTFSDVPAGSRQLNRHLVLHGRSTGFGTAENSVRLFFAFDVLAAVIAEAEERSTEP
jgi:hypothetical protein